MLMTTSDMSTTKVARKSVSRRRKQKKFAIFVWVKNHFGLNRFIGVLAILIVATVILISLQAIDTLLNVPLDRVSIKGDSHFVSRKAIQAIINASSVDGFIGIDLSSLHKQLQALPWVSQVTIKRHIPDQLIISIKEETVVARWNNNSYVTDKGDIIKSEAKKELPWLPNFSGRDHVQVLKLYQKANTVLPEELKPIQSISVSDIGVVTLKLINDMSLVFDSGKFDQELGLWQKVYGASLKKRIKSVRRIDLRYANGVAVSFKKRSDRDGKSYMGGRD